CARRAGRLEAGRTAPEPRGPHGSEPRRGGGAGGARPGHGPDLHRSERSRAGDAGDRRRSGGGRRPRAGDRRPLRRLGRARGGRPRGAGGAAPAAAPLPPGGGRRGGGAHRGRSRGGVPRGAPAGLGRRRDSAARGDARRARRSASADGPGARVHGRTRGPEGDRPPAPMTDVGRGPTTRRRLGARGVAALLAMAAISGLLVQACTSENVTGIGVNTVRISPQTSSVVEGLTVAFEAEVTDREGQSHEGRAVIWSSDDEDVAVVNQSGVATALEPGRVTIRARLDDAEGTAELIVEDGPSV